MDVIYAAGVAIIMGCGLFMLLSRQIVRIVLGVMLLSTSACMVIFLAGRIGPNPPPVMRAGETALEEGAANPLPQALVLTAIVIGFSLVAFAAALALQTFRATGTLDTRDLDHAARLGAPDGKEAGR